MESAALETLPRLAHASRGRLSETAPRVGPLRTSVVIPTRNEEGNIAAVLRRLPVGVHEVILVDGLSTDRTVAIAQTVLPGIRVVGQPRPGKGAALRAGFEASTGDVVVMLDADGSMDPREIQQYVVLVNEGYDLVKGSRFLPGGGSGDITGLRSAGNKCLRALTNALFGVRFSELCYGYMALRRDRIGDLALDADGFEIETQIVLRAVGAGFRIAEVPSYEEPRRWGASHLSAPRDGWRVLRTILSERVRRRAPAPGGRLPDLRHEDGRAASAWAPVTPRDNT